MLAIRYFDNYQLVTVKPNYIGYLPVCKNDGSRSWISFSGQFINPKRAIVLGLRPVLINALQYAVDEHNWLTLKHFDYVQGGYCEKSRTVFVIKDGENPKIVTRSCCNKRFSKMETNGNVSAR